MATVSKINGVEVADMNAVGRTMQVVSLSKTGITAAEATDCVAFIAQTGLVSAIDLQANVAYVLCEGAEVQADASDFGGVTGVAGAIVATFSN